MKYLVFFLLTLTAFFFGISLVIYILVAIVNRIRIDRKTRKKPFIVVAFVASLFVYLLFFYGYFVGRWNVETDHIEIQNDSIPTAFNGYKIVQISDLHLLSFENNIKKLERLVKQINALEPDVICFTGDIISFRPAEILPFKSVLTDLRARDGILSVLGNHDCMVYLRDISQEEQKVLLDSLILLEKEMGWQMLNNQHFVIRREKEKITFVGVMNQSDGKSMSISPVQLADLRCALDSTDGFRILLSHDPTHWHKEVRDKLAISLTLSGHTHNAQISFFGLSPARLLYEESSGLYENVLPSGQEQKLYINNGIGCTVPFRIGVPQQITLFTLNGKQ